MKHLLACFRGVRSTSGGRGLFLFPLLGIASMLISIDASASPYVPEDDNLIITTLPQSVIDYRRNLKKKGVPKQDGALKLNGLISSATQYIRLAKEQGDARWYGYAEAALKPWWETEKSPIIVKLMKATLLQQRHDFAEAISELDDVINADSRNRIAIKMRAQIALVQGRFKVAEQDCRSLLLVDSALSSIDCLAQVQGMTGQAKVSFERLTKLINNKNLYFSDNEIEQATITLAVLAHRLGYSDQAQQYYSQAIQQSPNNSYLLIQTVDFLLEQDNTTDAISLMTNSSVSQNNIELQVSLMAAYDRTSPSKFNHQKVKLTNAFKDARARQERFPFKAYAKYLLVMQEQPESALDAAFINWKTQKSVDDTFLLLRAMEASEKWHLAGNVLAWIDKHGIEDIRISEMRQRLSKNTSIASIGGRLK